MPNDPDMLEGCNFSNAVHRRKAHPQNLWVRQMIELLHNDCGFDQMEELLGIKGRR